MKSRGSYSSNVSHRIAQVCHRLITYSLRTDNHSSLAGKCWVLRIWSHRSSKAQAPGHHYLTRHIPHLRQGTIFLLHTPGPQRKSWISLSPNNEEFAMKTGDPSSNPKTHMETAEQGLQSQLSQKQVDPCSLPTSQSRLLSELRDRQRTWLKTRWHLKNNPRGWPLAYIFTRSCACARILHCPQRWIKSKCEILVLAQRGLKDATS